MISIGNLQLGGSGKTPLVAAIAAHLDAGGRRVAVLSRGYGRATRGPRLASRGNGPEASAAEVGDEPRMLAEALPRVAVVVGEDRYARRSPRARSARRATRRLRPRRRLLAPRPGARSRSAGVSARTSVGQRAAAAVRLAARAARRGARGAGGDPHRGRRDSLDGAAQPLRVGARAVRLRRAGLRRRSRRDDRASSGVAARGARHRHRASRACGAHRARARARRARAPGVRRSPSVPAAQSRPYRACPCAHRCRRRWWSPPRIA